MRSVYIHVPFCERICSYCDFTKMICHEEWIGKYLSSLKSEIKTLYNGDTVKSIYIGGGTPTVLSEKHLTNLLKLVKIFNIAKDTEITIECNVNDLNITKVKAMYKYGINRVSIGVQTLDQSLLKVLNREHSYENLQNQVELLRKNYIENINFDLMYAIPGQTIEVLKSDLDLLMRLKPSHISAYSLTLEPHTKLYIDQIEPVSDELDRAMYDFLRIYLKGRGLIQYEVSNYAKPGFESVHNLTYWNNDEYYGFGLGASSYIDRKRVTNTSNLHKYLNGIFIKNVKDLSITEQMSYEMILNLRKRAGINRHLFYEKYGKDLEKVFDLSKLQRVGDNYIIKEQDIYCSNHIMEDFI